MSAGRPYEEHYGVPRLNWESDHEWRCRTVFLDTNKTYYDGDRLAAYSMSWANWKFMGNLYSPEVQDILEDCHQRLPPEIDQEIRTLHEAARPKVKFVKSSENLGGRTSFTPGGDKVGTSIGTKSNVVRKQGGISAPLSSQPNYSDPRVNLTQAEFAELLIPETETEPDELIPGLIVYLPDHGDIDWKLGVCIINESCQRCNIINEFVFEAEPISKGVYVHCCILFVKSVQITKGSGSTKKEAKINAAKQGIIKLMEKQPIIYKSDVNHDHLKTVEKGQLVRSSYETAPKIGDNNLGNQLLRKMGWKGSGGIGKHESGIKEPIFLNAAEGRKGVGHEFKNRDIKRASVEQTLMDFIRNDEATEIRFSNDLGSEERAIIHMRCQKFNLKHKSHGKGEDRYLVVSKKVS